jgi:hypothetical protein
MQETAGATAWARILGEEGAWPSSNGGVIFLLSGVRMIHIDTRLVWPVLLVGIGVAFLLEWLYGKRPVP